MSRGSYEGPEEGLDVSWQYWHERPAAQDDDVEEDCPETVYATPPEPPGEERTENVPIPDGGDSDREGQSTIDDWTGGRA